MAVKPPTQSNGCVKKTPKENDTKTSPFENKHSGPTIRSVVYIFKMRLSSMPNQGLVAACRSLALWSKHRGIKGDAGRSSLLTAGKTFLRFSELNTITSCPRE
jgi:hypothetical protein